MDSETQYYIESQTCCACSHFHWGMGEMGTCDLREYKSFNDIGEWSDKCSIGMFEHIEEEEGEQCIVNNVEKTPNTYGF